MPRFLLPRRISAILLPIALWFSLASLAPAQQIDWSLVNPANRPSVTGSINGLNMGGYAYGLINTQAANYSVLDECVQCLDYNCSVLVNQATLTGSEFTSMQTKPNVVTESARLRPAVLRFPGGTHSGWYHFYTYDDNGFYDAAAPVIDKGYGMNVGETVHLANPKSYCENDSRLTVNQNYIDGFINFVDNIQNASLPDTHQVAVTYVVNLLTHFNFDPFTFLCLQTCGHTPALTPMPNYNCGQSLALSYLGNEALFNNDPDVYRFELYYKETQDAIDRLVTQLNLDSGDVIYVEMGNEYYFNDGPNSGYAFSKYGMNAADYADLAERYSERLKCYFAGRVNLKTGIVSKPGNTWHSTSNASHHNFPGLTNLLSQDHTGDGKTLAMVVDAVILHDYYTSNACLPDNNIDSRFDCAKTALSDHIEGNNGLLKSLDDMRTDFPNFEIWLTEWSIVNGTDQKNISYLNTPLHAAFVQEYALRLMEYNASHGNVVSMATHHRIGYDRPWSVVQTKDGDNSTALVRANAYPISYLSELASYDSQLFLGNLLKNGSNAVFDLTEAKTTAFYQPADARHSHDRVLIYFTNKTGAGIGFTLPSMLAGTAVSSAQISYLKGDHLFSYGPSNGTLGRNIFKNNSTSTYDLDLDNLGHGPLHNQLTPVAGVPVLPNQADIFPAFSVGLLEIMLDPLLGDLPTSLPTPQVRVFPSPTQGVTTLSVLHPPQQGSTIELVTLEGRILQGEQLDLQPGQSDITLDLSHLPAGLYFLHLRSPNGLFVKKLVKQ